MTKRAKAESQIKTFRKAARKLGADESEARFDASLKAVARHKPKADSVQAKAIKDK